MAARTTSSSRTTRPLPQRPGRLPACASTTGHLERGQTTARHPAPGRETSRLGRDRPHPPWQVDPRGRHQQRRLISCGHRLLLQYYSSHLPPSGPLLKAANGQQIPCWGRRQVSLFFGSRHYSWSFLLTVVDFNIPGVDFLQHFQLTVDVAAKRLRHHLDHITTAAPGDSSLISSTTAPMAVPALGQQGWLA